MTTTQPPLDPRKSPWKRGDVCTLGFKKNGFVLSHTPEYLEVRWMSPHEGIERIPAEDIDDLLRVMHADGPSPSGKGTNLESLEASESLRRIKDAVTERMKLVTDPTEKRELDALIARSFSPKCAFDRKHGHILFDLAIDPQRVSLYWKLRERLHRLVHHH
jgi:hypothetical protein